MNKTWKNMSDKELWEEYKGYYECVRIVGCYGTKDAINLGNAEHELISRGYEITYYPIARKYGSEDEEDIELIWNNESIEYCKFCDKMTNHHRELESFKGNRKIIPFEAIMTICLECKQGIEVKEGSN